MAEIANPSIPSIDPAMSLNEASSKVRVEEIGNIIKGHHFQTAIKVNTASMPIGSRDKLDQQVTQKFISDLTVIIAQILRVRKKEQPLQVLSEPPSVEYRGDIVIMSWDVLRRLLSLVEQEQVWRIVQGENAEGAVIAGKLN